MTTQVDQIDFQIRELRVELIDVQEEMSALAETSAERDLTDGERQRFENLSRGVDKRKYEIERLELRRDKIAAVARAAANPASRLSGDGATSSVDRDPMGDPRDVYRGRNNPWDGALERGLTRLSDTDVFARAIDAVEQTPGMSDAAREVATRKLETARSYEEGADRGVAELVLATSDPHYVAAFSRWVAGDEDTWSTEERDAARRVRNLQRDGVHRAMSTSSGFLAPTAVDPSLILDDAGSTSAVRQLARVKTTSSKTTKFVTSTAVTASWDGEAVEVSDDSPTLTERDITAHKAQAFVPFSIEYEITNAGGLTQELSKLFSDAKDNLEATAWVTGSGTNQPWGFVTRLSGTASEIAANTADTFALSDVYDLEEELPVRYRRGSRAAWLANKRTYQAIREAGGANLDDFWASLQAGVPERLLGYRAFEESAMDGVVDASADNRILCLADWQSFYGIHDVAGMVVERVQHLMGANRRPTGERGLYCFWMTGGDRLVLDAARLLNA